MIQKSVVALLLFVSSFAFAQKQENVQLLKGMDALQLQTTMNFIRGSLGVHCDYCHVYTDEGGWMFPKDDKPTKVAARKMIQLTMDINNKVYEGRPVVSCYTCHQGHVTPTNTPPLPQPAPPFPTPDQKPDLKDTPTAEAILAKYFQAIGKAPIIQTMSLKGTTDRFESPGMATEVYVSAPQKIYIKTITKDGPLEQVTNGQRAWSKSSHGTRELHDSAVTALGSIVNVLEPVKLQTKYSELVLSRKDKVGSRDVYVLYASNSPEVREEVSFDTETGFLLRHVKWTDSPVGRIPQEVEYDDYKSVNGVMMPFVIHSYFADPWIGTDRKFTEIVLNPKVDESKFDPPAPE
jgi:photosynthetic reaction center cytochrome c subunit